ncbi:hypothetical protein [Paenibacillus polymyxa]|uniref:hypothetical protein n=1 Tax=Paenibacillus polymyxa TaxID=1406 RepID=UPI002AB49014|nr:hypothetical protein [Paenibacillus polymyxa]MDY8021119.1 hypothetical protein [Paenibacillus polymyxa]
MTKKIEKQKEEIKHLLGLACENPDLKIVPMVDSQIVADDGHMWWIGGWGEASVEEIWNRDERVYIRSEDEINLIDEVCDNICDDEDYHRLTSEEFEAKAKSIVDEYKWEKVIAVKINVN